MLLITERYRKILVTWTYHHNLTIYLFCLKFKDCKLRCSVMWYSHSFSRPFRSTVKHLTVQFDEDHPDTQLDAVPVRLSHLGKRRGSSLAFRSSEGPTFTSQILWRIQLFMSQCIHKPEACISSPQVICMDSACAKYLLIATTAQC